MIPHLDDILARRRFGMKPGLDTIRALMERLGNPQDSLRCVHVAGTNGKGQTCAYVDSILRAAGCRTARYTSPHLVAINERFFLDGAPAPDAALAAVSERVHAALGGLEPTFFEYLTAMAFCLFADFRPDVVVLETGLGGRLDATNVISRPLVSAITRIGLDHCEWLGSTVEEIAREKEGIVKPGCPVVRSDSRADETFAQENARTARKIVEVLRTVHGFAISDEAVERGLASAVWPGRFQRVEKGGRVFVVDGAHNPPACEALAASCECERLKCAAIVCGFCGDKDVAENLRILRRLSGAAFAVPFGNPRAMPPDALAEKMREAGFARVVSCKSLADALDVRLDVELPDCSGAVIVCGSLFLAGEALLHLGAWPWSGGVPCPNELLRPPG